MVPKDEVWKAQGIKGGSVRKFVTDTENENGIWTWCREVCMMPQSSWWLHQGGFVHRWSSGRSGELLLQWRSRSKVLTLCRCHVPTYVWMRYFDVYSWRQIPQKLNLPMNFFWNFLLSTVSKSTIKMTGHHSCLRDMMGQSCPIYACTSAYHAHYLSVHVTFCGSSKHTLFKVAQNSF